MKILLSPAKLMSMESEGVWLKSTPPKFIDESGQLMDELRKLNAKQLKDLMKISSDLAELNVERNHNWTKKPDKKESSQVVLAFDGMAYKGLNAEDLAEDTQDYLNDNLFILSGLYGILRPSDRIMPYRLEMGSRFGINGNKNLYSFWKKTLTNYVNSKLKKDEILLNLASVEYSKVLDDKELKSPKIEVEFLDFKNGELKPIMAYFKKARGMMTRFCAENNINSLDEVKSFDKEGYAFDEKLSKDNKLIFTR